MPPQSTSHLKTNAPLVRESWMAYDTLIAKAFQPHDLSSSTPSGTVTATPTPTLRATELYEPQSPQILTPDGQSLEPIWDAVRQLKVKALATLPSKVKSLEGVEPIEPQTVISEPPQVEHKKLKRKSSATFRESPDGRLVTAVFDMGGVSKQDMHVSFKGNRVIVTWRRTKVVESMEDGVRVRERKEKQYSQMIPLPEGTQFKEVRAARSGQHLMLTFPNLRCIKVDSVAASSTVWSSGETDFFTCEAGTMLDLEEFLVEKDLSSNSIRRPTKKM